MASTTPNIGLTLPTGAEKVSRQIINDNNTKIDTAIGTLNSKFVIDTVSGSLTLSASATDTISVSATKTGYTPIGIIGITVSGTTVFSLHAFYITSSNAIAIFQNTYNDSRTGSITFTVLYQKT